VFYCIMQTLYLLRGFYGGSALPN